MVPDAQAAPEVAHKGIGEANHAGGQAAVIHQLPGEHEEGDGHEDKAVGP